MKKTIFSQRLTESMKVKGVSQTALAKLLRTTQQTISRWCSGFCEPDFNTLLLICGYLDEDVNYLLGYQENSCRLYAIENLRDIVGSDKKFQKEQAILTDRMFKEGKSLSDISNAQKKLFTTYLIEYCEKIGIVIE